MAKEHSILRSAMDSIEEAHRLTERYNKRDIAFKMKGDDYFYGRSLFSHALVELERLTVSPFLGPGPARCSILG